MANLQELMSQREALDKQIEEAKRKTREEGIAKVRELMAQYGLTPEDLPRAQKGTVKTGTKLAVKFRDPATGEGWSGRGHKPKWLEAAIAKGKKIEDFAVK